MYATAVVLLLLALVGSAYSFMPSIGRGFVRPTSSLFAEKEVRGNNRLVVKGRGVVPYHGHC